MHTKLIIFDFDGTLADTTRMILETYRMTIEELALPTRTEAECQATIGLPLREGFRKLFPELTADELDHCVATYRRIFNENKKVLTPELYPGVKETLEKLAAMGIEMSIASSRSHDSLMEFCKDRGIENYFSLILGADDVRHAKPDPEPVIMTLTQLRSQPEATIVVGDMPVDIAMGKGAGCRTVGITYGNSDRDALSAAAADCIIDDFPSLLIAIANQE